MNQVNPFLEFFDKKTFGTRDECVPFDKIKNEHFIPAIKVGIEKAKQEIEKIKAQAHPNFENTIVPLESCSEFFEIVVLTYFNLFSAEGDAELQGLAAQISPLQASFSSEITLDEKLFSHIEKVYNSDDAKKLTVEQFKLLEKYYKDFVRNGARLSNADKEKLRKIDQDLSVLGPKFSENLLKATNDFEMYLTDSTQLKGLPDSYIEIAASEAAKRGQTGKWLVTLDFPSFKPFMQFSENRELRQKLWYAYQTRCTQNEVSNFELIEQMLKLRQSRAEVLGFKNWAELMLQERMAQSSQNVMTFLEKLYGPSKLAAEKEIQELKSFKKSLDGSEELQSWDLEFYSEKLKQLKFKFSSEELRPYLKLDSVVQGMFEHARRLFGLTFNEIYDVPKYHPDVRTFEVKEENTNKSIGIFYTDFFPRETKKSGAWMTIYREQGLWLGKVRRPHVSIVCNFTKPTTSQPSLLNMDELTTLFHEFGHALHGLLSDCTYRSLAGTNVYLDFVELPSQIMENWAWEKETLDIFARHYISNEPIPAELVQKLKKAQQFQAGYLSLRQLQFGFLDMALHSTHPDEIGDIDQFEDKVLGRLRVLPKVAGTNTAVSFSHIFSSSGYSSGYYSYKWAEVLDADAFEFFKEKGLYNREVSDSFRKNLLSKGSTDHPMNLFKNFRGREPDPDSLLKRDGLIHP